LELCTQGCSCYDSGKERLQKEGTATDDEDEDEDNIQEKRINEQ
jgi:hypothetical protein